MTAKRPAMADIDINGEHLDRARKLADKIKAERIGLDNEDALAAGVVHKSYARAAKYRDQDRARINGMVIALTYMLGRPLDMQLAELFIADDADGVPPEHFDWCSTQR